MVVVSMTTRVRLNELYHMLEQKLNCMQTQCLSTREFNFTCDVNKTIYLFGESRSDPYLVYTCIKDNLDLVVTTMTYAAANLNFVEWAQQIMMLLFNMANIIEIACPPTEHVNTAEWALSKKISEINVVELAAVLLREDGDE
jgi:hypothetical protein